MATPELVSRARQGDGSALGMRTDPYRRERHVHRYRIPGPMADAEAGPETRYERNEAISLASISVLQFLPFGNSSLARLGLPGRCRREPDHDHARDHGGEAGPRVRVRRSAPPSRRPRSM
jgi:hypothetical protein